MRSIRAMARSKRIVDYVDMPLQHAHPDTLRRMRRGGSAESHLRLLARFRKAMPDVALRTTLIVGFPGETDREYEALLEFVREARFAMQGLLSRWRDDPRVRRLPNGVAVLALHLSEQELLLTPEQREVDHCIEMVALFANILEQAGKYRCANLPNTLA